MITDAIVIYPEKHETFDDMIEALFWKDMYIIGDNLDYIIDTHSNRIFSQLGHSYTSLVDRYKADAPITMYRVEEDFEAEMLKEFYEE